MAKTGARVPQKMKKSFERDVYKAQGNALGLSPKDHSER
jgi:hypothetical protein